MREDLGGRESSENAAEHSSTDEMHEIICETFKTSVCMIKDLQSECGVLLNGSLAQVMGSDATGTHLHVRIHPADPKGKWNSMTPDNLMLLSFDQLRATCSAWGWVAVALFDASEKLMKSVHDVLQFQIGIRDMLKMEGGGSYKKRLDVSIHQLMQSCHRDVKQMLNSISALLLSVYCHGDSTAAVMKTKALVRNFSRIQSIVFEHAGAAGIGIAAGPFRKIEHTLDLVCESLCTDFVLARVTGTTLTSRMERAAPSVWY